MLLSNAKVPPFNSTLMGLIKGVSNFYELGHNDTMVYGGSGHAFMINIHETLCPSGPYCWNRKPFYNLLPNIGIQLKDEGFFTQNNTQEEREKVENILKKNLDENNPCGLINLEYQLISGYDDTGFITSQPWAPKNKYPPEHLTFNSWDELGKEFHINFFTFKKVSPITEKKIIIASLSHAYDLFQNPSLHTSKPYSAGFEAYETWIKAIEAGHGSGHGNWWNATVWGECRQFASKYMEAISEKYPVVAEKTNKLKMDYKLISDNLYQIEGKKLEAKQKIKLLLETKNLELSCSNLLPEIIREINES